MTYAGETFGEDVEESATDELTQAARPQPSPCGLRFASSRTPSFFGVVRADGAGGRRFCWWCYRSIV